MALTKAGKIVVVGAILGGLFAGVTIAKNKGLILQKVFGKSQTVGSIDLPTAPANAKNTVPATTLPSGGEANVPGPQVRLEIWEWNAQMGLLYANGGKTTVKGSLMEKGKVNLKLTHQDMTDMMATNLLKFATEYSKNPATTEGAHGVVIMGDGAPAFLAGLNPKLIKQVGPDYRAEIVTSFGYSHGEDAFMGSPEWRAEPAKAKGSLIAAVIRDGDWNIVVKWAGDNGIQVNPDETTWDANAINFVNPTDYIDASNKYVAGYCEDRAVVVNGTKTGEKKHVCVNGVATWTPGDVIAAQKKGGLVKIASTKEYSSQMPAVLVVIKKWADDNRPIVDSLINAANDGADQIKCYSAALDFAGKVSADVYGDQDGAYWVKYYNGTTETDKSGLSVDLGGSKVNNLADNLALFGLLDGSVNTLKIVYNTFGGIDVKLYPVLVPSYPNADSVIDVSFLKDLQSNHKGVIASADVQSYSSTYGISQKVSEKAWAIEFESGSATLSNRSARTLDSIANQAIVATGLRVALTGYTDNQGNPEANKTLSFARAQSVKAYLSTKYGTSFPDSRVSVDGKGQDNPIADNTTAAGRAKNRRVVVLMGK